MAEDRVAVVTGGSRGLGAALVAECLRRGMRVGTCSRSAGGLTAMDQLAVGQLDVADGPAVEAFGQSIVRRFGRIDLWINNAGLLAPIGKLADVDAVAFGELMQANVMGVFNGSATFARIARGQSQGGTLINISSGAARGAYRGWSGYCGSKAAVDRMSECLALEEGDSLRVHSVAPGIIETDMQTLIRDQSEEAFPDVGRFKQMHAEGALVSPAAAAAKLLDFALSVPANTDGESTDVCVDLRD